MKLKRKKTYKEARESHYWLRLLRDSAIISYEMATPLISEAEEIMRIHGSSIKTLKSKLNYK